ncbi:MAG: hypothetical protein IPK07_35880 [Deltaproteobacteria bacterium]|nr:hypothetical protein [Deltaproteobacteria bacterium]
MSVLTLLTDGLLLAVLVWLVRRGALAHARARWFSRAKHMERAAGSDALRVTVDDVDALVVAHRPSGMRWADVRPCGEPLALCAGGEVVRIHRTPDGSVSLEAEGDIAVVSERSLGAIGAWTEAAPHWVVAPRGPRSAGEGG